MQIVTLDFETFYDTGFSLSRLTTEEYIKDDRFQVIGYALKIDEGQTKIADEVDGVDPIEQAGKGKRGIPDTDKKKKNFNMEKSLRGSDFFKNTKELIKRIRLGEADIEDLDEDATECCEKLGGHFNVGEKWSLENQNGTKHGVNGHSGDLCNNLYSLNGKIEKHFMTDRISLYEDDLRCVLNRSIIIHEDEDDCALVEYVDEEKNINKFITGNAGKRIACGNIQKVNNFFSK